MSGCRQIYGLLEHAENKKILKSEEQRKTLAASSLYHHPLHGAIVILYDVDAPCRRFDTLTIDRVACHFLRIITSNGGLDVSPRDIEFLDIKP